MIPARGEVWLYERPKRKGRPVLILLRSEAMVAVAGDSKVPDSLLSRKARVAILEA